MCSIWNLRKKKLYFLGSINHEHLDRKMSNFEIEFVMKSIKE